MEGRTPQTPKADDHHRLINPYAASQLLYQDCTVSFSQSPLRPSDWLLLSRPSQTNSHFLTYVSDTIHTNTSSYFLISPFIFQPGLPSSQAHKRAHAPTALPTPSPRLAHRLRFGDVVDLHAHALLYQLRENLRMRRDADEPPGVSQRWSTGSVMCRLSASRLLKSPGRRRRSCG